MTKVAIYTTPTCPWCKKTKAFLNEKKIPYQEKDVSTDQKAANEMVEKSGQMGVPVLDIGGKIIVGYDPDAIIKAAMKDAGKVSRGKTAGKKSAA